MRMYDEPDYAANRLQGTIVRYKGKAISVIEINGSKCIFTYVDGSDTGACSIKDLDINPVPLGYINHGSGVIYAVRMPMRQDWKQGLRDNSLRDMTGFKINGTIGPALANTIEGKFPTLKEAITLVKNGKYIARAFDRDFSINTENNISYKGKLHVGKYSPYGKNQFDLFDKYFWLEEIFKTRVVNAY